MKPKVSVIVSVYNGEKYIREQLDSILNQTYPLDEIIIADDCSTDNSWSILCEYAKENSIIKTFRHEKNLGMNKNFNFLIEQTSNELIVISDQDDIWLPHKVEKQVEAIGENLLCFSFSKPFRDDGEEVYFNNNIPNYRLMRLIFQNTIPGHTLLIRKKLFYFIPAKYKNYFSPDKLLALTAATYESIVFIPQVLIYYRHHISSISYTKPLSYKKSFSNMFIVLFRTFKNWIKLREKMKLYYKKEYIFLELIDSNKKDKNTAKKMLSAFIQGGVVGYLKTIYLNLKYQDQIFYCKENNRLLSIFRALYFFISSSDYFRYMLKDYKRE